MLLQKFSSSFYVVYLHGDSGAQYKHTLMSPLWAQWELRGEEPEQQQLYCLT